MRQEMIDILVKRGALRIKQTDEEKIKSLVSSIIRDVKVAKSIPINNESTRVIFREMYEAIRQLGDARWWRLGYEPLNHEVSMEILQKIDITENFKLNFLNRFKHIRHDVNYRGCQVTIEQVQQILDFWNSCSKEIIDSILSLKILFICKANVGRSQMATAFFNSLSKKNKAIGVGTHVGENAGKPLHEFVIKCMAEESYDLSKNTPQQLTEETANTADKIIVITEKENLPIYLKNNPEIVSKIVFWDIPDAKDKTYKFHCKIRDEIKELVEKLVEEIG
ncbi:low molecular weight phosphatase family protein [Candidatus Woesearchaeota archaeon]|nr:low molecular weight phosphatase family protein [Candidatus Woesearchaeota archaeon]